jgi:hypothetical protein
MATTLTFVILSGQSDFPIYDADLTGRRENVRKVQLQPQRRRPSPRHRACPPLYARPAPLTPPQHPPTQPP